MLQDAQVKSKRLIGPPALVKEVLKFLYCGMPPENLESITICFEGDQKIQCHKVVLVARSSYFRGLLQSGMIESRSNQISMTDISRDLFRRVLQFLYSGQLPDDMAAIAFDLLPFAEKYVLDEFKSACENAIMSAVSADNVMQAIILADKHHCPNLFRHCLPIIKNNIDDLQKKEEWESLIEQDLFKRLYIESCKGGSGDAGAGTESGKVCGEFASLGHAMQLSTDFGRMFDDTEVDELVFILEHLWSSGLLRSFIHSLVPPSLPPPFDKVYQALNLGPKTMSLVSDKNKVNRMK